MLSTKKSRAWLPRPGTCAEVELAKDRLDGGYFKILESSSSSERTSLLVNLPLL